MWTTLEVVSDLAQADMLCAFLDAHGIETFLPEQGFAMVDPLMAGAVGGIRVQVRQRDLAAARRLLGKEQDERVESPPVICPRCGSVSVIFRPLSFWELLAVVVFLGIPLIWLKPGRRCRICGYVWKT